MSKDDGIPGCAADRMVETNEGGDGKVDGFDGQASFAEERQVSFYFRPADGCHQGLVSCALFLAASHKGRVVQNGFRGREREELLRLGAQRFFNGNIPNGREVKGKYGESFAGMPTTTRLPAKRLLLRKSVRAETS